VCGKVSNDFHEWDECKCKICGTTRHKGEYCKCTACGQVKPGQHSYRGCKCFRCGQTRNIGHEWYGDTCRLCNKVMEKCPQCGKRVPELVNVIGGGGRMCKKCVLTKLGQ
jgi:hypothetical protein